MSDYKEAYKQAEQEMLDKKVEEVKGYIKETLEKIEQTKKEKANVEERLRILKLDLEDLKNGKFDKIQERARKSDLARETTVVGIKPFTNYNISSGFWPEATSGTYQVTTGTVYYF